MARKIKTKSKCPICKKDFQTQGYTIRQGMLKGVFCSDSCFCSDKCKNKFDTLLRDSQIKPKNEMKKKCKVIGCINRVMDGDFGLKGHTYGYCQIHKIEGTAEEITQSD